MMWCYYILKKFYLNLNFNFFDNPSPPLKS